MAALTATSTLMSASGMQMPVFGLGTFLSKAEEVKSAVNIALEAGYRLIDTAFLYSNEAAIGKVLAEWLKSGKLKREELFVTTKLPMHDPNLVRTFLERELTDLQLDYVDLYLVHNAVGFAITESFKFGDKFQMDMSSDHLAVWKEMEKLVDTGSTKAIGLSNFNVKQIERVMKSARIRPANLQIQIHIYCQSKEEQQFCKKNGITLTSYGTFGSPGAPVDVYKGGKDEPLKDPVVLRVAAVHGKTPGQVLLRHLLQIGIAVIPKSANPERIRQNLQVFDFELSESEIAELNSLDKGEDGRRLIRELYKTHPEYPYRL